MDVLTDITPLSHNQHEEVGNELTRRNRTWHFDNQISQLRVIRVLGEGAFGEVKLVVDKNDPEVVLAVKVMDLNKYRGETKTVKRESLIHRLCSTENHPNVLKYLGMQMGRDGVFYQFMEYADGGELFDQIEPDVGIPSEKARFYFRQLINGLEHIHSKGIVHRDLKPENLLLTKNDILKISDFGMATIFRHGSKERMLDTPCGSRPYAAPELIAQRKYWAQPIDIWSSGVVLVTLLVGELPWESPEYACDEFRFWISNNSLHHRPWNRIDTHALSLLKGILQLDPIKRMSIERIKRHPWLMESHPPRHIDNHCTANMDAPPTKIPKLLLSEENLIINTQQDSLLCLSNECHDKINSSSLENGPAEQKPSIVIPFSFTQPAECTDSLLLSTQFQPPGNSQPKQMQNLVRRMTRLCLAGSKEKIVHEIESAFSQNGFTIKKPIASQVVATSLRGGGRQKLVIIATFYEFPVQNWVLIDFRRSRGDGLEFKRVFTALRNHLQSLICPDSYSWMVQHGFLELSMLKQLKLDKDNSTTLVASDTDAKEKE